MEQGAISIKGKRYRLWRIWDEDRPLVLFLLLNPSIGDATQNDPTIKRLIFFAQTQPKSEFRPAILVVSAPRAAVTE